MYDRLGLGLGFGYIYIYYIYIFIYLYMYIHFTIVRHINQNLTVKFIFTVLDT